MHIYNMHEAKTHLSRLVTKASHGESFVIARAGKPLVKVIPINAPMSKKMQRLGFMIGELTIPDDFDQMGRYEIDSLFEDEKNE